MTIQSLLKEGRSFPPPQSFSQRAHIKSLKEYEDLYHESIDEPEEFWSHMARDIHWFKEWKKVHEQEGDFHKWFVGGKTNACYNCVDRHLEKLGDKPALVCESWDGKTTTYTYKELHAEVCRFANVLKSKGVGKGDRVVFYLQMVPQLPIGMLACARIGAIHSVVFGGFSAESLKDRIQDSEAKVLVTMDESYIHGKPKPVKATVDAILDDCETIRSVLVVKRTGGDVPMDDVRDNYLDDQMDSAEPTCDYVELDAEDPLFILYTSGTTGKPKGVVHTNGGYIVYAAVTTKYVFDLHDEDVYWCTADCGWITGHSYIVYGPLANGATSVIMEGSPLEPAADRCWQIVDKHKISVFYTAPTLVRALMREGTSWVEKHDLSSLRLLGSVGEPINPEAWVWYHENIGKENCPIVDTWWQTETGGIMITPLPGATPTKPGSATLPFFGIAPAIYREDGTEADANEGGSLVITKPWPSMLRTVWKNPERYQKTYFGTFPGVYLAGDSARKDEDGYLWILGRLDDVVNVSGHRLGTAEIESALVSHPSVAEAAVAPYPQEVKGQALYAFVTLRSGVSGSDDLVKELRNHVGKEIGPIAKPDKLQFALGLPKTRSGKIMRRILKAIAEGKEDVGNTMTLANPEVVETLIKERIA